MKKSKKWLYTTIVISILSLSSCGEKLSQEKQPINEMNPTDDITYSKNDLEIAEVTLKEPGKIASDMEYLYICDTGNDRIVRCNFDGTDPLIIGELGSMDGEFSSPECIAVNANKFCVYDRENQRIQVFTKNGEFNSKYELKDKFSSIANIIDIEMDNDDNIYFSIVSYGDHLKEAGIYVLTSENEIKSIKQLFVGNLYNNSESKKNDVYYVSRFELQDETEWQTGYSEFGIITDSSYSTKNAFSSLFSSIDITETNNNYMVYDDATQSIYKFDEQGNCSTCVFSEDVVNDFVYTGFCSDPNDCLYLSDRANSKIYVLKPLE